jgi:small subunit ribosomal protein S16
MLRIRFQRVGSKNQPAYRIVVIDQRQKRSGDVVEAIGFHNPRTRPSTDQVNSARALHWLSVGAQPTDAAKGVLRRAGTWALYERLQKGEDKDTLLTEAATLKQAEVSPKTSYPAPVGKAPAPAAKDDVDAAAEA